MYILEKKKKHSKKKPTQKNQPKKTKKEVNPIRKLELAPTPVNVQ
jgi:hypothetical protein